MVNKIFLYIIIVLLWVFASIWCFNHIDPWIGIGVFILGIYISVIKSNKKTEKK